MKRPRNRILGFEDFALENGWVACTGVRRRFRWLRLLRLEQYFAVDFDFHLALVLAESVEVYFYA